MAVDAGQAGICEKESFDHLLDDQQGIVDQLLHELSVRRDPGD
jgi:hypothetical protein